MPTYSIASLRQIEDVPQEKIDLANCLSIIEEMLAERNIPLDELNWMKVAHHLNTDDFYYEHMAGQFDFDPDRRQDACQEAVNAAFPNTLKMPYHINEDGIIPCTNCSKPIFWNGESNWEWIHLFSRQVMCYPKQGERDEAACPLPANDDGDCWYNL